VPKGFSFIRAECAGAKCSVIQEDDNLVAITFKADKNGDFEFKIKC
jgi:hypothetical protein